ncbi:MAG: antibiotic biosynthesis monooxygenase [Anaerohalosphaeraceae bacterium]
MHVTCVTVQVKADHIEDFIRATIENHKCSVQEPGNLRFDLLQHGQNPCQFLLYEAYASDETAAAHKKTAHYLKWRDTVADWMAAPREGTRYQILCPADKTQW